ncbi:MAG: M56 family metallopeptidase [Terracidiphilus sp.]
MISALVEAALRALLVAVTVWTGLRIFRVSNVLAQKLAWGLVLAAAVAVPLVMRWQILPAQASFRVPLSALQMPMDKGRQLSSPVPESKSQFSGVEGASAAATPHFYSAAEAKMEAGDRFPAPSISKSQSRMPLEPVSPGSILPWGRTATGRLTAAIANWFAGLRSLSTQTFLGLLYFAVLACLLFRMINGLAIAARMWLAAEPVVVPFDEQTETDPAQGLRLRASSAIPSPVTVGSGVLLPADYLNWDAEKLRIVLAHERSHVRQGDFYLQLLASLYAAVFWFSPLGWWLKRKLSDLGEAISDRAGLQEATSRATYAQVLLEFAALPRPTAIGVAMARTTNLSHRIERLLNEVSFRQAFAGSRRRILLAVLLVPVALFVATALIRVEAASSGQSALSQSAPAAPVPVAVPDPAPAPAADSSAAIAPAGQEPATPAPPATPPDTASAPQATPSAPPAVAPPAVVPTAPAAPPAVGEIHDAADDQAPAHPDDNDDDRSYRNSMKGRHGTSVGKGYSYSYSSDGDSYALITDSSQRVTFSGEWHDGDTPAMIDKVRTLTNGKFLWFTHNGKSYFIDDPGIVSQIQAMYMPMQELGRQQEELGKKQEALGRQQEQLGRKQEQASIPTPDISKEMAKINDAVAKLQAKKGSTVSQDELADLEGQLGDLQGRLGELQGEVGAKQGEIGAEQGKLGEEQGRLGAQQGLLGAEQGKLANLADRQVKSIILESLRSGKARPVE